MTENWRERDCDEGHNEGKEETEEEDGDEVRQGRSALDTRRVCIRAGISRCVKYPQQGLSIQIDQAEIEKNDRDMTKAAAIDSPALQLLSWRPRCLECLW